MSSPRVLIVAYGNPLRSDDGVAWRAAEQLRRRFPPQEVDVLCLHQLAPELAETLSRSEAVIFVDAAANPGNPGEAQIQELNSGTENATPRAFGHSISPATILELATQLYCRGPRGFCATIVGQSFDHGEVLSPAIEAALPDFVSRIEGLVGGLLSNG